MWAEAGEDRLIGHLQCDPPVGSEHLQRRESVVGAPETPPAQTPGSEAELAEQKARAAWDRLGTTTRDYLAACARLAVDGNGFSIDDVAAEMGPEHSKKRCSRITATRCAPRLKLSHATSRSSAQPETPGAPS